MRVTDYLAGHGTPRSPDDLVDRNCLAFHYIKPEREWLFRGAQPQTVHVTRQLTVDHGPALLRAALSDIGIVMLPDYLVAEDLAAGRLVRLFSGVEFPRVPVQLVYLADRHMTPKMKSFVDFVLQHFG